jgi:hypothetical protein
LDLKKRGFASGIPNWTYDDSYIIDYAKKKNAYILTNDRYRDHIENYSKNDMKLKEDLRIWVKEHCIKLIFSHFFFRYLSFLHFTFIILNYFIFLNLFFSSFTFIGDDFIPDPDFLLNHNII